MSWRVGLDWAPTDGSLVYGNVTRGFKAGNFPRVPGTTAALFAPNEQEEVTAYELGIKQTFDTAQLNAALFYYDYIDKQAVGNVNTGALGVVPAGVSLPEAEITGFEVDGIWQPTNYFSTTFAVSYLDSEIGESEINSILTESGTAPAIDQFGTVIDLEGLPLPTTSEWNVNWGAEFSFPIDDRFETYFGWDVQHRSEYFTQLSNNPVFEAGDYTTLDLRVGFGNPDEGWDVQLWGRNVTDEYYLTAVNKLADHAAAVTGRPATYGITFTYRPY